MEGEPLETLIFSTKGTTKDTKSQNQPVISKPTWREKSRKAEWRRDEHSQGDFDSVSKGFYNNTSGIQLRRTLSGRCTFVQQCHYAQFPSIGLLNRGCFSRCQLLSPCTHILAAYGRRRPASLSHWGRQRHVGSLGSQLWSSMHPNDGGNVMAFRERIWIIIIHAQHI
ncbi:hypothetical protein BGZ63DRAFT_375139 [Mariannaea sp. PMI_226]|nr:hypothetical protein BGZ63DRAFT_375139 [Mariannaea sp. PMI_226]